MIQFVSPLSKKHYIFCLVFIFSIGVHDKGLANRPNAYVNNAKLQLGLMNGINYLISSANPKPEKDAVMLINTINTNYKTHLPYPTLDPTLNKIVLNSENLRIMGKWYNPNFILEQTGYNKNIHGVDSFMIASLYCEAYGLPNHFIAELDSISKQGGYYLTHSCLQFQWCLNNGCLDNEDATIVALKQKLTKRLAILLSQQKDKLYDVGLEAIAVHNFMKIPVPNKSLWIKRVLNSQLEDGGWAAFDYDHNSYPHSTALATWVLVDYLFNNDKALSSTTATANLTPSELFCSYNLIAKLDSNIHLSSFENIFSFQKTSEDSGAYTGSFVSYSTLRKELLKNYYNGVGVPTLYAAIQNPDSLAYLIEYKNHFQQKKSNEVLDRLLKETFRQPTSGYTNYLKTIVVRCILEDKKIQPADKTTLAALKKLNTEPPTTFTKLLELFVYKY